MKGTRYFLVIIFTTILFLPNEHLTACSCIGEYSVKSEIKSSDAVLVGTILGKTLITLTDSSLIKMFPKDTSLGRGETKTIARYDFRILEVYKGKISKDTISIYTGIGKGDCGIRFEVGDKYIIYAKKETYFGQQNNDFKYPKGKNHLWTDICSRTTKFNEEEIAQIEKFVRKRKRILEQ